MNEITLTGPLSPQDVSVLLTGEDRRIASLVEGYRGTPVSTLALALVGQGVCVDAVTTASDVDGSLSLEGPRFRLTVVPSRKRARDRALDLFAYERRQLERALADTRGVVHAHWTYEFAWAASTLRRPYLVTAHDAPLTVLFHIRDAYRFFRTLMAYRVRALRPRLTAVSPYLADCWHRQMMVTSPIRVIPNIVPPPVRRSGSRLDLPLYSPLLIDIADNGPHKNIARLLEAFASLRRHHPNAGLAIAGPGLEPGGEAALRFSRSYDLTNVHLLGRVDRGKLNDLLDRADMMVHPSLEEACPMVLLEAMGAGIVTVGGRRSGGVPWVLDSGRAGLLVDVADASAIATGIDQLLSAPERARDLAEAGRSRAHTVFSADSVAQAYLDEYERACRPRVR